MSEELKPCPFCGSPADPEGWSSIDRKGPACTNGDCDGAADSAEAWNKRASNTLIEEQAARISSLTAELEQIRGHRGVAIQMANTASETATEQIARATASQARLSEAVKVLESVVNEEYVPVHVGYDDGPGGGNFVYANAVRVDSDAFIKAKAFITTLGGEK
jgi:uncharacterized protein (UPF0147 family)